MHDPVKHYGLQKAILLRIIIILNSQVTATTSKNHYSFKIHQLPWLQQILLESFFLIHYIFRPVEVESSDLISCPSYQTT